MKDQDTRFTGEERKLFRDFTTSDWGSYYAASPAPRVATVGRVDVVLDGSHVNAYTYGEGGELEFVFSGGFDVPIIAEAFALSLVAFDDLFIDLLRSLLGEPSPSLTYA